MSIEAHRHSRDGTATAGIRMAEGEGHGLEPVCIVVILIENHPVV